jgi:hypothetical protein
MHRLDAYHPPASLLAATAGKVGPSETSLCIHSRTDFSPQVDGPALSRALAAVGRLGHAAPQASVNAAAHFAGLLCDDLLRTAKEGRAKSGLTGNRDFFWIKAARATAEFAVGNGFGRDAPPLSLGAAIALLIFERHAHKTPIGAAQVWGTAVSVVCLGTPT